MKARDVMTTAVISVDENATVEEAVRLMLDHHVSGLPVVDSDGRLVGMLSEGDLLRRLQDGDGIRRSWWLELISDTADAARDYVKARSHRVVDVMTTDVLSVSEDSEVADIAHLLETRRIKRVPVVRDGRVVGIVSRANLIHALAHAGAEALPTPSASDEELRKAVDRALREVPGLHINLVNYTVEDGRVSIWGVADSDAVEDAVRVAAENVPGVKKVDVHMGRLPAWSSGI
ncbi:MAG: CBS domain-containing protein [Alphaproteobacteria bacterium]|nr:MAG: CBS domain-containing protein [Alphaproteobacteria bacterium]